MTPREKVRRLAAWSIAIALFVMALKYAAYAVTGSVALFSDALESIVNVIAAGAAYFAIRLSYKPADEKHPHGHHKAEYFSAVLEGVLIVLAAWETPAPLDQPWRGLAINGLATAVNAAWAALLIRAGRAAKSPALQADGRHIMTDVITSVGVIAGLVAAVATGLNFLDPLLAVIVALNILWQGWQVIAGSVQGLMDVAVEPAEAERIRGIISGHSEGAIEIHDLKTRIAGRATFIEFHLVVDSAMSVGTAHRICDRIEDALKAGIASVRVTIHVEPDDEAKLSPGGV